MGREVLAEARVSSPAEARSLIALPPWAAKDGIVICPDLADGTERQAPADVRRRAALEALDRIPRADATIWLDGSVACDGSSGGGGAVIESSAGVRVVCGPAGAQASSFRAELVAIRKALEEAVGLTGSIALYSDSRSSIQMLQNGPESQNDLLGAQLWELLSLA
jgi:hypothetical protein